MGSLKSVPREVLSDNASGLTRKPAAADWPVEWNSTYLDFARDYGFVPRACRPYRARSKGKVERPIRYIRRSFRPVEFEDLADLIVRLFGGSRPLLTSACTGPRTSSLFTAGPRRN